MLTEWSTTFDDTATTHMSDKIMTAAVLQGAPSLSNPDGDVQQTIGQRGHGLNASGYGSWPYIIAD